MRKILGLLFISSSIFSMQLDLVKSDAKKVQIQPTFVFVPNRLGSVDLYHGKKGFSVIQDNKKHQIQKHFTDPMVRDITKKQLEAFLDAGYLSINQMNDGTFSLKANGRVKGGGPVLGTIAYWVTKTVCYGTAVAAVGTVTVATGGALGAAVGVGTAATTVGIGSTVVATTAATTIATTAGVVTGTAAAGASIATGAGLVGAGIAGAGLAGEAAVVTAGVVSTAGSVGATIAGVEALSVAVGSFFGMLPTP